MENVKGLLTKDNGRFKVEIMREMRSIIDDCAVGNFLIFADKLLKESTSSFFAAAFLLKLQMEITSDEGKANTYKEQFFDQLDSQMRNVTRQIDYRTSKSNRHIKLSA